MIQDIFPKKFDNQYRASEPRDTDIVFCFTGTNRADSTVLTDSAIKDNPEGLLRFPCVSDIKHLINNECFLQYLFSIDDTQYFLLQYECAAPLVEGFSYESTRILRRCEPVDLCFAGMTAFHLYVWYSESRFCGKCGHRTIHDDKLRMMKCPDCGHMIFPKIAPAVIIGLRNKNSLMMSRYAGRDYKGRALLAGFCEIGETPEETVVREVMEEVGLKATNVTYYGSQPWGFDSNLLLGYFADLDGDDSITLDTEELASAGFVEREDIEYDPNLLSLTATMIEEFRLGNDK